MPEWQNDILFERWLYNMAKQFRVQRDHYFIGDAKMVNFLVRQGFDLIKAVDDKFNPKKKVYLFIDDEKFRKAMEKYKK